MSWKQLAASFAVGAAIDIGLVWLFYWLRGEEYQWMGFWIWQAVLIGAGIVLWLRKMLGTVVWYYINGREHTARTAFENFVKYEFEPFDPEWDTVEGWLNSQTREDRASSAMAFLVAIEMMRTTVGVWNSTLVRAAYRKAAIRYTNAMKRRPSYGTES